MRDNSTVWAVLLVLLGLVLLGVSTLVGLPKYLVWQQGQSGLAKLREAEYSRQILVQEGQAKRDAAGMLAEAEIARAKGVAEANRIIGDSLQGNEAYLRYLWVQGLSDGNGEVIYVPTEANIPILEATRLQR